LQWANGLNQAPQRNSESKLFKKQTTNPF